MRVWSLGDVKKRIESGEFKGQFQKRLHNAFLSLKTFLARRAGAATASTQFITNDSHKLGIIFMCPRPSWRKNVLVICKNQI